MTHRTNCTLNRWHWKMFSVFTIKKSHWALSHSSVGRHRLIWHPSLRKTASGYLELPRQSSTWRKTATCSVRWWISLRFLCRNPEWQPPWKKLCRLHRKSAIRSWSVLRMCSADGAWRLCMTTQAWKDIWKLLSAWPLTAPSSLTVS